LLATFIVSGALLAVGPALAAPSSDPKVAVRLWYEAFDSGKASLLDDLLDSRWVDIPSPPSDVTGPAAAKASLKGLRTAFPDFAIKIEDVLQDGDKVVVRSRITATQRGVFLRHPASDRALDIQAVDIHQFSAGKIIRTWHTEDWMTGLRQLGLVTSAP
jgi:steroid delta-isomerase-like uncharacterized protein